MSSFPEGFLWGAATAAHQIEGGNVNANMWADEWMPNSGFAEPSGDACDSYHRYPEDIGLLAAAGLNAYRFSIEWARIEPEEGWFSRAALDHYRRMVATCLELGVAPLVTLQHFTCPKWFPYRGGWEGDGASDRFARYAERVAKHLGDLTPWIATINEANLIAMIVHVGMAPVGSDGTVGHGQRKPAVLETSIEALAARAAQPPSDPRPNGWISWQIDHMAAAHRKAVEAIKSVSSVPKVGWTLALVDMQSVEGGEERCERGRQLAQLDWLDVSAGDDFVGVQNYSRERVSADGLIPRPDGPKMETGWEFYPPSLEHVVRLAADRAGVPIIVTENGVASSDDGVRIAHTREALQGLARCIDDGIDVRGYTHWTLLDNFEWVSGFDIHFGLIAVDRETFARTPKPSLAWLGEIAQANCLDVA